MVFFSWSKFKFMKIYNTVDVFTPTQYADLTFVERTEIRKKLSNNLDIPGKQMVIYGHSGGGKSTLVNKVLISKGYNFINTPCMVGTSINDIILDAFDKLNPYYISEKSKSEKFNITEDLKASYLSLSSSIKTSMEVGIQERALRVLPVQLTPQRLIDYMGAAQCIWVIEDFHKVEKEEKIKLSQIMKLFVDKANTYKKIKIIAIGAVDTAREVVNYDSELSNRICELHVPLLEPKELRKILDKGTKLLNIEFSYDLKEKIVQYSNRSGSICHQLSLNICQDSDIHNTSKKLVKFDITSLDTSIKSFLDQNSDTFKQLYDKVTKQKTRTYENVKLIFEATINLNKEEFTHAEILAQIHKIIPQYPQGNLSSYLKKLTSNEFNEVLRLDENSNKYSFSDPIFKAYVIMVLKSDEESQPNISKKEFLNILEQIFDN